MAMIEKARVISIECADGDFKSYMFIAKSASCSEIMPRETGSQALAAWAFRVFVSCKGELGEAPSSERAPSVRSVAIGGPRSSVCILKPCECEEGL